MVTFNIRIIYNPENAAENEETYVIYEYKFKRECHCEGRDIKNITNELRQLITTL